MDISNPSLYAAFGNKEQLYLSALERYREQQLIKHVEALAAEPDLKSAMRAFLRSVAIMLTSPELPGGCMVVNSAVACDRAACYVFPSFRPFGPLKDRLQQELQHRNLPVGTCVSRKPITRFNRNLHGTCAHAASLS